MELPRLRELRTRPLPEAGAALASAKSRILDRWRAEVKEVMPECDELTRLQLENSLPELLDGISVVLASDNPAPTELLIAKSPEHGTTRFHQDFSLAELLVEYHLLRRIVMQEMSAVLGRSLESDEAVAVNQGIDVTLRQAAVAFAMHQTAALKTETAAMAKFLSFLSHDLRGGLNGAVLMIEVLKRQLSDEPRFTEAVQDLDTVRRSILDTVSTMERFLNAEKLRLGRMPVKLAPINVPELLAEIQRTFAFQLEEDGVQLQANVPVGMVISSDRQLLAMVLQNLISNGIKYGRRGVVTVDVSVPPEAAGVSCRFAVKDNGPGLAPEKIAELFAAFSRGDTYGQKGVGLGLFIARQAADLLGAKLWAESKLGQGSTFYLDLPRG